MPKTIQERFFNDPEWYQVEELINKFIEPLLDMSSIDTSQPAEAVKAEIIGRRLAYKSLRDFIEQSKLVGQGKKPLANNPFR